MPKIYPICHENMGTKLPINPEVMLEIDGYNNFLIKHGSENLRIILFVSFFWTFSPLRTKIVVLVSESSKIVNAQKLCQNGTTAIIEGVMSNFRFFKNSILDLIS